MQHDVIFDVTKYYEKTFATFQLKYINLGTPLNNFIYVDIYLSEKKNNCPLLQHQSTMHMHKTGCKTYWEITTQAQVDWLAQCLIFVCMDFN